MARSNSHIALLALATSLIADPAAAQFTDIFRDPPPRPPANVPGGQPLDRPPPEPLPPPLSMPPSNRPGAGQIQSQPLPPPPGTGAQQQNEPIDQRAPPRPLPGLAPGQRQPRGTPQQPASIAPPADEVVVAPPEQKISNPTAVFSGLDKITGRIIKFDVAIDETVQFGALQVTPRACYSRPPTETQNTDAFVAVDEVTLKGDIKRIFTGWMFATSPGLHAVEHAIYDVWLTDCKGGGQGPVSVESPAVTADVPLPPPKPR